MGAIETLIVWELFDVERIELMGPGGKTDVKHLTPEQVRPGLHVRWDHPGLCVMKITLDCVCGEVHPGRHVWGRSGEA
eukprot:103534-Pelagomonas_calceolata.AAC.1